jgi:hypothetical protein
VIVLENNYKKALSMHQPSSKISFYFFYEFNHDQMVLLKILFPIPANPKYFQGLKSRQKR